MRKFPYIPAKASNVTVTELYRVTSSAPTTAGIATGDILRRVMLRSEATGVLISQYWLNEDQQTTLAAAPVVADIEVLDGFRVVVGSERLTVSTTAVGFAAKPTVMYNLAECQSKGADIAYTLDGTTNPNGVYTGPGYFENDGGSFELESRAEIVNFKAIRSSAALVDAVIEVTYYRTFDINI